MKNTFKEIDFKEKILKEIQDKEYAHISGYESDYYLSPEGDLYHIKEDICKKLVPIKTEKGFWHKLKLSENCYVSVNIARLIAEHYIEKPINALRIKFKDDNVYNYSIDNLQWIVPKVDRRKNDSLYYVYEEKGITKGLYESMKLLSISKNIPIDICYGIFYNEIEYNDVRIYLWSKEELNESIR